MRSFLINTVLLIIIFLLIPIFFQTAIGQPPPPPPQAIPIDGGVSLLVAAGVAFGARKLYKDQKEKNK